MLNIIAHAHKKYGYSIQNPGLLIKDLTPPDTLYENQLLYNGKIWRNLYYMVKGDQFLFSKEFLPGTLTMVGKTFTNVSIKYDLYNDEILTPLDSGGILQLNKEMVDGFSIFFQNKTYKFIREDSLEGLKGYVNVIYKGKSALYAKHIKKIGLLAEENKYDKFYQVVRIYFVKDNIVYPITSKSDLFKVLHEDKKEIKDFIKKNNLVISKDLPESFYPIIRYYDSINQ
jgi:hypothetical protein